VHFDGDYKYGYSRVADTFLYHKERKELLKVLEPAENFTKLVMSAVDNDTLVCNWDEFSFAPPKLGLINTLESSFYVEKIPKRNDWRQGLRSTQFQVTSADRSVRNWLYDQWKWVNRALKDPFPSLPEAIWQLEEYAETRAISRYFSVTRDFELRYRNRLTVGVITDNDALLLNTNFFWLEDQLKNEVDCDVHVLNRTLPL
jgi:hypothetical protein